MQKIMTLKPGLLVSLRTTMRGGVSYEREELGSTNDGETRVEEWKTRKVVQDKDELERATKVRSKAGSLIRSVCIPSAFGHICPLDKKDQLEEAIKEARSRVETFNNASDTIKVGVFCITGQIAQTDDEAARAIQGELAEMMEAMKTNILAGNVDEARKVASEAKKFGSMLDESNAKKVSAAIEEIRTVGKEMVKKIAAGADKAELVRDIQLKAVDEARFAFLDADIVPVEIEPLPATDLRGLDVDSDEEKPATVEAETLEDEERKAAAAADAPALEV